MAEAAELSKSAKRRAAKKARDAAHPAEAAPAAPETTPEKPKAKAAAAAKAPAAEPKAKPKEAAKAAAKPKAAPKEEPKKPDPKAAAKSKAKAAPEAAKPKEAPKAKADPKAKAGAAKAKAKAEPAPPPPAPEPAPKAKGKAKAAPEPKSSPPKAAAKSKAGAPQKKEEDTAAPERVEVVQPFEVDDGTGGEWEQSTGLSKKAEKRKEKQEMMKKEAKGKDQKLIPGMAPINTVPGMAPPKAASKEEIAAFIARAAEKGTAARTAEEEKQAAANALHTQTIKVPENKIGIVIGPKGSKIKMIQEKTGVARIDTSGEIFTIAGPQQAVEMAYAAIKELIEKGYCAMAFEDFKEEGVMVHPSVYPDIIGKGGVTIKAFKTELNVEVTIPEVPKNATGTKKYKVTLAGKADDVRRAKEVLTSIMKYGHHEVTHPDQTHEEMEVEEWAYKFLIGKAGSELRHIQNNYKVKVNIPRPHSECQNVVIVGGVGDVSRAKDYIDNLMWKAQNQPAGGRGQDAAIDPWGEEEEEDWMKAYIYKR